jgi:hypothetical protein
MAAARTIASGIDIHPVRRCMTYLLDLDTVRRVRKMVPAVKMPGWGGRGG